MRDWDEGSRVRAATLRDGLDIAKLRGLEVGPLSHPVVFKHEGDILYVDYAETERLRVIYKDNPYIDTQSIVDVDALWGERSLSECVGGSTVDYVMASHVAEHVPDIVTWLDEVHAVLTPGGQLRMVMPDKRFSTDALRRESDLTDVLAAWMVGARRPQLRDVLDFRLLTASKVDGAGLYAGLSTLEGVIPDHTPDVAIRAAAQWSRDHADIYLDVHCWVFSARTFAHLMRRIAELGLLKLACVKMIDTSPPYFEFFAFLTPSDDQVAIVNSWHAAEAAMRDPLPGSAAARAAEETMADRDRVDELRTQLQAAKTELQALRDSRSWRLTAPVRRLRRALGN